ncbi:MAG: hypothetical protein ACYDA3_06205 [Gaiellaceae bacterium]
MAAVKPIARATLVGAVLALVAVLVLARMSGTRAVATPHAVTARATLTPPVVQFGDRVTAVVDVVFDRNALHTSYAEVQASFAPLAQLSAPQAKRTKRGGADVVHYTVQLACLDQICAGARRVFQLPPAHILVGGESVPVAWPKLVVRGRVTAQDLEQDPPPLVADASVPQPSYRLGPSLAATLLEVLAVVLALGGVALGGHQAVLLARARRKRASRQTQLERALLLAREAGARGPADRRRAVGLLARLLARRGDAGAEPARDLAWSATAPAPEAVEELVSRIERELP